MSIASSRDIAEAFAAGRVHTQRFFKNTGQSGNDEWQDWSYTSGQPAYDARIGIGALTFSPYTAVNNDAIYFPPVAAGQERHIISLGIHATPSGTDWLGASFELYDLLGVYPLIDGDSTDQQDMDNTLSLPRYDDGVGVRALLVNHVAPSVSAGNLVTINYVDANDAPQVLQVYNQSIGVNKVNVSLQSTGGSRGILYLPTEGDGVKSITSLTFSSAPGGLWAIYLLKPLVRITNQAGAAGVTQSVYTEKCLCATESFNMPRVYDGAWLGFFYTPTGTGASRSLSLFGNITFIWE